MLSRLALAAAAVVCLLLPAGAHAGTFGVDVDLGTTIRVGNDTDLFVSVSARYFDRDAGTVAHWASRYRNPDDLAVSLFLCHKSGASPDYLFALRSRGLSWVEVAFRLGLPWDVWFVPVERVPGPPFGHAYGYWKKHRGRPGRSLVLADTEVRDLVAVRVLHEYYGIPVEEAMARRAARRDLRVLVAAEYRSRHGEEGHRHARAARRRHGEKEHERGERGHEHREKKHGHGERGDD